MTNSQRTISQRYSTDRNNLQSLVLLWALGEAGLGGILHATGLPLTGFFVGGWAVVCLSLMGLRGASGKDFLLGLTQVLIIKALASPHSPFPAYIAVGFQGLLAAALFGRVPWKLAVVLLAVLTMTESGAQKILTVTLVFGAPFWQGVEALAGSLFKAFGIPPVEDAAWWIAGIWVGLHTLTGGGLAVWILGLPARLKALPRVALNAAEDVPQRKSRRRWLSLLVMLAPLVVLIFLPPKQALYGILRAWAALFIWFTLGSWLTERFRRWLQNRREGQSETVQRILGDLPYYRRLARAAWQASGRHARGLRRPGLAAMLLIREGMEEGTRRED